MLLQFFAIKLLSISVPFPFEILSTDHARLLANTLNGTRTLVGSFQNCLVNDENVLVLRTLSTYNCFKDAQRIAKDLGANYSNDPDKLNELLSVEQVADIMLLPNLVCRLGTLDQSLKVYFEFSHHPYFAFAVVNRT
ncbi:hypothetical protein ACH5RR_004363 [Cinchona calisaya]|uniref:NAA35-like TPR repeats domain-containing protein n=1 Tax=Cinchona calisaya TaxID=153742 RepID=A0ABD3AY92_9GENT